MTSPRWTPVQGRSLGWRIISLIMVIMVPATFAHVVVVTSVSRKKNEISEHHPLEALDTFWS